MRQACVFVLMTTAFTLGVFGQNDLPTFKSNATSMFVWGEDAPEGAVSSTVQDPLTGHAIPKLSYAGIEVSSRMGFEGVSASRVGNFLGYSTTIVNGTDSKISVRYGGAVVDGHLATPLSVVPQGKHFNGSERTNKKDRDKVKDVVELGKMNCFSSDFLSSENFFSADAASKVLSVNPRAALTVSSVIRDPRNYSVRCSADGCYPTGTMRYYIRVNSQDYVFVWPGRSAVYCGK